MSGIKREAGALLKAVHARSPLRINDIGGWTDTWFARQGKVLNLAVLPGVEVQVRMYENRRRRKERVRVRAENYGRTFSLDPDKPGFAVHPLLQYAVGMIPVPRDVRLDMSISSSVPAGISTGTSASVCVAVIGALSFLFGRPLPPDRLFSLAHEVETVKLKQQSGIQDQISAAYGGVCFIDMFDYPQARVERLDLPERTWNELDRRICLIYLGRPHSSSAIHEKVIALLEKGGGASGHIEKMKAMAEEARNHLMKGDLESYGEAMIHNNECQRALSPGLVSETADRVISTARRHGASGWKVNGAGGRGGSLAVLASADDSLRRKMLRKIQDLGFGIRTLAAFLSVTGFTAWEESGTEEIFAGGAKDSAPPVV